MSLYSSSKSSIGTCNQEVPRTQYEEGFRDRRQELEDLELQKARRCHNKDQLSSANWTIVMAPKEVV
jgi:hypothetical protein